MMDITVSLPCIILLWNVIYRALISVPLVLCVLSFPTFPSNRGVFTNQNCFGVYLTQRPTSHTYDAIEKTFHIFLECVMVFIWN